RRTWPPPAQVPSEGGLGVENHDLPRSGLPDGHGFAICIHRLERRGAPLGFVNPAIRFVTQAIIECESGRDLPRILEEKVVSLAADRDRIKIISLPSKRRGRHRVV